MFNLKKIDHRQLLGPLTLGMLRTIALQGLGNKIVWHIQLCLGARCIGVRCVGVRSVGVRCVGVGWCSCWARVM